MRITGVLESCLYATDLDAAERFYAGVLGLVVFGREAGRHLFFRCGDAMFLVFDAARTSVAPGAVGGVAMPAHGATGAGHIAFRIAEADVPEWRARLRRAGVGVEAEIAWPRGGRSLYVRDPAGNSVELATPVIWGIPERDAAAG